MGSMICKICKQSAYEDETIWGLNPVTFRLAIMHYICCVMAFDDCDRKEEYILRASEVPH